MKAIRKLRMAHRVPARQAPAPLVVVLGNSTVRLVPTAGRRLLTAQQVELATGVYVQKGAAGLPQAVRALLTTPGRRLVVCSVQREALQRLRREAKQYGQPVALYGVDFGPGLAVRLPAAAAGQVGRDRLAACAGAAVEFPAGALVCDVGTALTINHFSALGFEGGLIAPGVQLGLQALHAGTSQLPAVAASSTRQVRFPGKNTVDAMDVGCRMAVAGAIEKIHAQLSARARLPLILTGGSAIMIRRNLAAPTLLRPHLVATGVWSVFLAEMQLRDSR